MLLSRPAVPTRPAALLSRPALLCRKLRRLCLRLTARQSPATLAGVVPTAQPSPSARFRRGLLPLFFGGLLWLIYVLNIFQNGNFEPVFPPVITFINIFVAENVAK